MEKHQIIGILLFIYGTFYSIVIIMGLHARFKLAKFFKGFQEELEKEKLRR